MKIATSSLISAISFAGVTASAAPDNPEHSPLEALRKEVSALRVAEVPWRKIEWKTCLIDGLNTAKVEGKPLVLWIFIDRPIDDKRC